MSTPAPERPHRGGRPRNAAIDGQVLSAAVDLVIDKGMAGFSIERLAAHTGIAKTTIYRRWRSGDEVLQDALASLHLVYQEFEEGPLEPILVERVWQLYRSMIDTRAGRLIAELIPDVHRRPELFEVYWTQVVRPGRAPMVDRLRRAVAEGELRSGTDPDFLVEMLIGPILSGALFLPGAMTEEQAAFHVRTVLAGLRPNPKE
ncbi:TetR/AcrR family transcriptional regulator [Allokutzneria sp. A3M-2-11 16]|uniref:TetR/AcrR family transcriptional regulator n=1 Tax=Allokutzneria sp. A3M-2-11 16 TaxID=2962043 RepID=UPI0020B73FBC|nr:TetR/AcrR family transcriptional regulator [Allokutzneria sp. A3M-2-11 16]MCP3799028.1 TetR/AcrR family transcriptional regulator [Allokutzneria sp. A3M-2-11 16]